MSNATGLSRAGELVAVDATGVSIATLTTDAKLISIGPDHYEVGDQIRIHVGSIVFDLRAIYRRVSDAALVWEHLP